jgi:glycosyltransferase involved in cell wall biosynthesis
LCAPLCVFPNPALGYDLPGRSILPDVPSNNGALQERAAMSSVTISICVPTYNGALYLKSCLDSALAQTFKDFELVVVDDCSTDATLDLVRSYAQSDERIRVWRNERNLGLVANWNRCVEVASGEWVKFLFQDDLLEPSCLEQMLRASLSGVDLVVARRGLIFEEGTPPAIQERYRRYVEEHNLARHCRGRPHLTAEQFAEILLRNPIFNCVGEPTATLIRRSAFERYGAFNRDLIILGDWEYAARVAANTGLCYVDATLAHFRVHAGAATSRIRGEREYRAVVIDPLVLMHELCYSKHYANAREVAKQLQPPLDLRSLLTNAVGKALGEAEAAQDRGVRSDWRTILTRYPRLARSQLRCVLRVLLSPGRQYA